MATSSQTDQRRVIAYDFGVFQLRVDSGELRKNGHRVRLQPKVAALLLTLLERRGELVTRGELQARLWPEDIHVDFEQGLNIAVKKLRDSLFDDADAPRYLVTIPGQGYRFIGDVTPVLEEFSPPGEADLSFPLQVMRGALMTAGALMLAFAVALLDTAASVPFERRDWVVVADFENHTGEKELDYLPGRVVRELLAESTQVNVASGARVQDTLALMRREPGMRLDVATAQEVARRDGGIRLVIGGAVNKYGDGYQLSMQLTDPSTGNVKASFSETLRHKSDVLPALDRLTHRLRNTLGDDVGERLQPPQRVTSRSFKAVRLFTEGMKAIDEGLSSAAAINLLESAVSEDPEFGSAHVFLGHAFANIGNFQKAKEHFSKAYSVKDKTHDAERLFIMGSYYSRALNDPKLAVQAYEGLVTLYPDHYWGWNNLLNLRSLRGDVRHADAAQQMVRIRPNSIMAAANAIFSLDRANRKAEADALYAVWEKRLAQPRFLETAPRYAVELRLRDVHRLYNERKVKQAAALLGRYLREAENQPAPYRFGLNYQAAYFYLYTLGDRPSAYTSLEKVKTSHYLNGVFAEFEGDRLTARKHYRAATEKRALFHDLVGLARVNDPRTPALLAQMTSLEDWMRATVRAEILRSQRRLKEADEQFKIAIQGLRATRGQVSPWYSQIVLRGWTQLLEERREHARAAAVLEDGIRLLAPDVYPEFEVALLRAHLEMRDWEKVEEDVARLEALLAAGDPQHPFALQLAAAKRRLQKRPVKPHLPKTE